MARTGKIARLPLIVRDELCRRLRDGQPGSIILPWVNEIPAVKDMLEASYNGAAISDANLSEWRCGGGFEEWLKEQTRVDDIREVAQLSHRLAAAAGGNMSEGFMAVAAGKIQAFLEGCTGDDDDGGPDITKMVSALASIRGMELDTIKTRLKEKELGQKAEALGLEKQKFQRTTAEMFLKWFDDKRARDIVEGKGTKEIKVAKLIQLAFGDMPEGIGPSELRAKEAK